MTLPGGQGPDKPLYFDWGDNSPFTPANYGEIVEHTYASPGDYLITCYEAVTGNEADAPFAFAANPATPVLTVDDATVKTCELTQFNATLTNGFGEIRHVYSYVTLKATGMNAANTLYQRLNLVDGTMVTIAMTDLPDGSVRAVFGPFDIARDMDTVISYSIRLPQGVTGPVAGHTDYVTSFTDDPDTGESELSILISDDFTLNVTPGNCANPPAPGACTLTAIVPAPNDTSTSYDDNGDPVVTNIPQQVTTGQGITLTGTGLSSVAAMILVQDDNEGFPCQAVVADDDGLGATGVVGQLPTSSTTHFKAVLVQDQNNTARCQIAVDWVYTPGPIPEV